MPVGKTITECLQGLGVLDDHTVTLSKAQWPQNAKSLHKTMAEFAESIEEEANASGAGESLNTWVEGRAIDWVNSNSERWSANDRFPYAAAFPKDGLDIAYWVQQYVLNKWHNASKNRKKKETTSLPGLQLYCGTTTQTLPGDTSNTNMRDVKEVQSSERKIEKPETDEWNPYSESDSDEASLDSATAPSPDQLPNLQNSTSSANVPYSAGNSQTSHANNKTSQNTPGDTPAANNFRARAYSPIDFPTEMYSRITFLIGPSHDRNRHMRNAYARIMGLEEAQKAETFRAGVFERLGEMGEMVGSRKVVAKPDWMPLPFVVENDHDHHYLLEALKTWGEWKVPLCIVYVSLEHEV